MVLEPDVTGEYEAARGAGDRLLSRVHAHVIAEPLVAGRRGLALCTNAAGGARAS